MEFVMSSDFVRTFFLSMLIIVSMLMYVGYTRNSFNSRFAQGVIGVLLVYTVIFVWYRYSTGHMAHHVATEPTYVWFGAIHGMVALWAIVQTCLVFAKAARSYPRGENYFYQHRTLALSTALLWVAAFGTGYILMS